MMIIFLKNSELEGYIHKGIVAWGGCLPKEGFNTLLLSPKIHSIVFVCLVKKHVIVYLHKAKDYCFEPSLARF